MGQEHRQRDQDSIPSQGVSLDRLDRVTVSGPVTVAKGLGNHVSIFVFIRLGHQW